MTRLLLVRHGQSTWNATGRWQGQADPPLSEEGEAQAEAAAAALADVGIESVLSSSLQRARRTAEIIASRLGLGPVELVPGLREVDVGDWSGLTRKEIVARWPEAGVAWAAGRLPVPVGGEPPADFRQRVVSALADIVQRPGPEARLVVTHGGVLHNFHRHLGIEVGSIGNLDGRWFEWTAKGWEAGEMVEALRAGGVP